MKLCLCVISVTNFLRKKDFFFLCNLPLFLNSHFRWSPIHENVAWVYSHLNIKTYQQWSSFCLEVSNQKSGGGSRALSSWTFPTAVAPHVWCWRSLNTAVWPMTQTWGLRTLQGPSVTQTTMTVLFGGTQEPCLVTLSPAQISVTAGSVGHTGSLPLITFGGAKAVLSPPRSPHQALLRLPDAPSQCDRGEAGSGSETNPSSDPQCSVHWTADWGEDIHTTHTSHTAHSHAEYVSKLDSRTPSRKEVAREAKSRYSPLSAASRHPGNPLRRR